MSDYSIQPETSIPAEDESSKYSLNHADSTLTSSPDSTPSESTPNDLEDQPLLSLLQVKLENLTGPQALEFVQNLRSLRTNPAAMKALRLKEGSSLQGKRKITKGVENAAKVEAANNDLFAKLGIDV